MFPDKLGQPDLCGEIAFVIDGRENPQAVLLAGDVVVRAVARGDVDCAGACLGGDEIREDDLRGAVEEGVLRCEALQLLALEFGDGFTQGVSGLFRKRFKQLADDDEGFLPAVVGKFPDDVGEFRMEGDAEVRGQRPGRGGPDRDAGRMEPALEFEFHEDRRGNLVGVFHLRLGERGLCAVGPLDRLLGLVDGAVFHELREDAEDARLIGGCHRQVWVFPIAEDPEALEGGALDIDETGCELGAAAADFRRLQAGRLLDDLELDGQAVAIPTGDEGRVEAGHGLGFHHHVLEQLVERGAHVDIAIGEGRAVVEDEIGCAGGLAGGGDLRVESGFLPNLEALRLVFHKIPAHREICLRQGQRVFVIRGGAHGGRGT